MLLTETATAIITPGARTSKHHADPKTYISSNACYVIELRYFFSGRPNSSSLNDSFFYAKPDFDKKGGSTTRKTIPKALAYKNTSI